MTTPQQIQEENTFIKCEKCGELFNPAFLDQVVKHMHNDSINVEVIQKGKKVIQNARDVYPHCGGEFACGVHIYLKGEPCPERPCSDKLIEGWYCAERDLKNNYILDTQPKQ